ncbi:MerR family transcriptional regulator [Nicoliella lavandulae]|uniref:MerR family transcriptional regulator n=1 Tax=Nicoliella lavandulae TaxID=3082954 RepID=A0ABU8SJM9_9LACO
MDEDKLKLAPIDVHKIIFRIGEVSKMTGVSPRQLRYWDQKGFIKSQRHDTSSSRVYTLLNLFRVGLIKKYLDNGYTLKAAVQKTNERQDMMETMHHFIYHSVSGIENIDGKLMINMGYFDKAKTSYLYGRLDENDETEYKVIPVDKLDHN